MANQDDAKEVLDAPPVSEANAEPGLVLGSEVLPNIIPTLPVRLVGQLGLRDAQESNNKLFIHSIN